MFKDFTLIIPHYGNNFYRIRNLETTLSYYKELMPGARIILAEQNGTGRGYDVEYLSINIDGDTFHKTKIINEAVKYVTSKFVCMVDNDCLLSVSAINSLLIFDGKGIYMPFSRILNLTEYQTRKFIREDDSTIYKGDALRQLPVNRYTGGFNLFTKSDFDTIGGFEEAFKDWGAEDDAFISTFKRMIGDPKRSEDDEHYLIHLFHPSKATSEYSKSKQYIKNSKQLLVIKRMSDEDFLTYIENKKKHINILDNMIDKYDTRGELEMYVSIKLSQGTITMYSAFYALGDIYNENGEPSLKGVLQSVYDVDGKVALRGTIEQIRKLINGFNADEEGLLSYFEELAK